MANDELSLLLGGERSLAEAYPDPAALAAARRRLRDPGSLRSPRSASAPPVPAATPLPAPAADAPAASRRRPRVCIATADFPGPVNNGGIGTAYAALAEALAGAGHPVTVLYTGSGCESATLEEWSAHWRGRGVELRTLPAPPVPIAGAELVATAYRTYSWLKRESFDVVHFPEMFGGGFFAVQAKRLGLAFAATTLCAGMHGPTLWHRLANGERIDRDELLALDFLERESVARADCAISPSRYLIGWASEWEWRFPPRLHVQPYVSPPAAAAAAGPTGARRVDEIAFFGRLETRKGLELFCAALDLLAARGVLAGRRVTFLGKPGTASGEDGEGLARRRSAAWPVATSFTTTRGGEAALAGLLARPVLAVMPSIADNTPNAVIECLAQGIPFVSTRVGGIPELVAPADHDRVLAEPGPAALAGRIAEALAAGAGPARPAFAAEEVKRGWIAWHESLIGREGDPLPPPAPARRPLVSVCMATRDRPAELERAIASLAAQTFERVEVVLVDDGSESPAAHAALARLEPEITRRGGRVLSGPRRYPGGARNHAAAHARGEYLLFMDDDNLARPEEIETLVTAAARSRIPLLTCCYDVFTDPPPRGGEPSPAFRWLPLGPALPLAMFGNCLGDTNLLVRRDVFFRLGGFDEEPGSGLVEDWVLLSRAALAGVEMAVVPEPLFLYRRWPGACGQAVAPAVNYARSLAPFLEGQAAPARTLSLYAAGLHQRIAEEAAARGRSDRRVARLAERFARARPVLAIGPGDAARLEAERELEIAEVEGAIRLRSLGDDPIAWLPAGAPAQAAALLRVDLTAPAETSLQLFWASAGTPYLCEAQSLRIDVPAGRSVQIAEIPPLAHVGRLRLDPAMAPGDVLLHALELRCEPCAAPAPGALALPRGLDARATLAGLGSDGRWARAWLARLWPWTRRSRSGSTG